MRRLNRADFPRFPYVSVPQKRGRPAAVPPLEDADTPARTFIDSDAFGA